MKGGVEWDSAWGMTYSDREVIIKTINKRLKEKNPKAKEMM